MDGPVRYLCHHFDETFEQDDEEDKNVTWYLGTVGTVGTEV